MASYKHLSDIIAADLSHNSYIALNITCNLDSNYFRLPKIQLQLSW